MIYNGSGCALGVSERRIHEPLSGSRAERGSLNVLSRMNKVASERKDDAADSSVYHQS